MGLSLGQEMGVVGVEPKRPEQGVVMSQRKEAQGDRAHDELAGIDGAKAGGLEESAGCAEGIGHSLARGR